MSCCASNDPAGPKNDASVAKCCSGGSLATNVNPAILNETALDADGGCCSSAVADVTQTERGCCTKVSEDDCCEEVPKVDATAQPDGIDGGCTNGCCSSPPIMRAKSTTDADEKSCSGENSGDYCAAPSIKDGCCGGDVKKSCSEVDQIPDGCKDGCCSPAPKAQPVVQTESKTSCGVIPKNSESAVLCAATCCSPAPEANPPTEQPSDCCDGSTKGCCDETCLDRIAIRECTSACDQGHQTVAKDFKRNQRQRQGSDCTEGSKNNDKKSGPCSYHVKKVRQRFGSRLEALGCICRTLLAMNQESCCDPSKDKRKARGGSKTKSTRRADGNCGTSSSVSSSKSEIDVSATKLRSRGRNKAAKPQRTEISSAGCSKGCCGEANKEIPAINEKTMPASIEKALSAHVEAVDPEKGLSCKEHVVLSVSGMTCSGCETKLQRSLGSIQTISNLKTSLILARAEFDIDLAQATAMDIIHHIEKSTEFKCSKIGTVGSELEVIPGCGVAEFLRKDMPIGVLSVDSIGKDIVRITFDAQAVGARELEERFGVPLELAPPKGDPNLSAGRKHVHHVGVLTLISAILTIPVLVLAWAPLKERPIIYGSISLALATLVQVFIAGPFYPSTLKALIFARMIEMDLLIVLSTSAAYIFSVVSFAYLTLGKPLSTGEFFETSTLLVTLIMVGRFVSALARHKAVESISMQSLQVEMTTLMNDKTEQEEEIDTRLLQYGDVFKVMPDSRIPTDGTVESGSSEVDESVITGESHPVEKSLGSTVVAGTLNGSGVLFIRLSRLPSENTISSIASMVDEAKLTKPKIQNIADKVASYFVPVVLVLTIITLVIWIAVAMVVQNETARAASTKAITYAITVLIVSCPCAIGLAVPMVIVIAGGVAAKHGVIVKSAHVFEVARKATHIVFDKTGTLTEGKLTVLSEHYSSDEAQSQLLGLVQDNKHPVSIAITAHLRAQGIQTATIDSIKALPGRGLEGTLSGDLIRGGNPYWLELEQDPNVESIHSRALTTFVLETNGELSASIGLSDTLRPDAISTISRLRNQGIHLSILSGDSPSTVQSIAQALGIDTYRSRCSPADKLDYLASLTASDPRATTIFIGDGTNDAAALAQATIGIHINASSDVAKSAADVVLVRGALSGVPLLMEVSKAAVRRVGFNFAWAFVYNVFAVLLAAGAFVRVRIPPEFAGLGELVSVLPVILIALGLRWATFE